MVARCDGWVSVRPSVTIIGYARWYFVDIAARIGDAENAGLENAGPKRMGGIHRTGKRRTKFPGWKTHDHRLLNAKWISIKLKGTLYDMYIIL